MAHTTARCCAGRSASGRIFDVRGLPRRGPAVRRRGRLGPPPGCEYLVCAMLQRWASEQRLPAVRSDPAQKMLVAAGVRPSYAAALLHPPETIHAHSVCVSFSLRLGALGGGRHRPVVVDLPPDIDWVQVSDQATANQHLREWIPSGTSVEDADWLIAEQRFLSPKRTTAKRFLKEMMRQARSGCGPEKIVLDQRKTWHCRVFCARHLWDGHRMARHRRVENLVHRNEQAAYPAAGRGRRICAR